MNKARWAILPAILFAPGCQNASSAMIKCEMKRDPYKEQWFGEYIYVRSPDGTLRKIRCGESDAVKVSE